MPKSISEQIANLEKKAKEVRLAIAKQEREIAPTVRAIKEAYKSLDDSLNRIGALKVKHGLVSIADMLNYNNNRPSM